MPLDYARLIVGLAAMQAASRTAATEARLSTGTFAGAHPVLALIELIEGGPGWMEAVAVLEGAFHPRLAAWSRNGPP
ncbi:MAG: hypothetical protein ABW173_06400 [Sphingomonas sp.]